MNLESDKRLNIQLRLDFSSMPTGEARQARRGDIESLSAVNEPERPANTSRIMEEVCERANLKEALRQVRGNKGSAGVDRMTVDQLGDYLKQHWPDIREQLLNGTYEPKPVRRVEIPKPDGGVRELGIPTVLDRFIQQAVMQVLQRQWNPTFSQYSYGFRPRRSAHHAVAQAQQYIAQGYGWVIDLDLEKFFDRVNHDKLMGQIAKRVEDKRLLKLIRDFLNAGVMENGLVSPSVEGTPQGGPLSPLLSNLVLDELDRELENRGHRFVRYADDCNIYVRSERAGQRVMEGISRFIADSGDRGRGFRSIADSNPVIADSISRRRLQRLTRRCRCQACHVWRIFRLVFAGSRRRGRGGARCARGGPGRHLRWSDRRSPRANDRRGADSSRWSSRGRGDHRRFRAGLGPAARSAAPTPSRRGSEARRGRGS